MKLLYAACIGAVLFAACADRDPLSSTADPSTTYKAGKATDSSDPTAGLLEPRVAAQFTVRIENLGTLLAPGAWVAQRGGEPFFTDGQPDRGAGLEALAEDGNPAELAASLYPNSGIFNTPVGADSPGPLTPGNAYEFTFVARPGDRLSFATMYVQSNDLFLSP
ncbi:MAG: spondin domain-containing protein, partial [Gemmatimonadetes bacterium]|nr:spondin domain-containing protein [Gemmatimonadota bacterium]